MKRKSFVFTFIVHRSWFIVSFMRMVVLLKRNLTYYWRTNLAVIVGVAAAVAVLAGALLVGDSVRTSLRDLFLQRLGSASQVISAAGFFRERLADDIQLHDEFASGGFSAACPLIAIEGAVTHEKSNRRASGVQVYGVDDRFWKFHGRVDAQSQSPRNREILISASLADELGVEAKDSLLLRVEKPSAIPAESLHGRKEDLGRTIRLSAREALTASALGEFSLRPQQAAVRAVFVPLRLLQKDLEQEGKVNVILLSEKGAENAAKTESLERILKDKISLEDLGIKLRTLEQQGSIALESDGGLVSDSLMETARATATRMNLRASSILSYLANTIRSGEREVPYSLVTAIDEESYRELGRGDAATRGRGEERETDTETDERNDEEQSATTLSSSIPENPAPGTRHPAPILLNDWAARELGARPGDAVSLEYYLWQEDGRLTTERAQFQLAGIVPIRGVAADRDLVPEYPGITESESLSDWDPPFPIDLTRIERRDEEYWKQYRTTPKAFIPLAKGQELWQSRFGKLTSLRITPADDNAPELQATLEAYRKNLRDAVEPTQMNFAVYPARAQGLEASRGATDFGEYFLYFSFFLVVSALLLTALFFKLGVEQRLREIGTLYAIGFPASKIRTLFLSEAIVLATLGSLLGIAGALAYSALMMLGLRTWWVEAVGTTMLNLHVSPTSLAIGGGGGVLAGLLCIVWTLRRVSTASPRSMLTGAGKIEGSRHKAEGRKIEISLLAAFCLLLSAFCFLLAAFLNLIGQSAGFFGGGTLFLIAALCCQAWWLRRGKRKLIGGHGWWSVTRLGFRNAAHRPGRSVLCIALVASATFIIVAVDGFRRNDTGGALDRKSGSGGFPLLAESLLPLIHDPNTAGGREALNLASDQDSSALASVNFARFRVRPGDDASCLNLYQPRDPKIIAPTSAFLNSNRFSFQDSLAATREEKENPWRLLNREAADGAIPVIADANSMTYVLHLKLGDELVLQPSDGARPVRLRFVGALSDSVFQSELLMSEGNFLHLFPEQEGYRFFLLDAPTLDQHAALTGILEDRLSDYGFDIVPTDERLASFHRVENTFLSTFQMLGGLGLILGTLGMAAVLLRNVLERRRELALLRAVGYNRTHLALMVIAENGFLLFTGLLIGTTCALLASAPVFFSRGALLPNISPGLGLLLLAVLISGLIASLLATTASLRSPLLSALRAE